MSLRRSPRRTVAFLAANRANAQKSTEPRTAPGKQHSAANALRTGNRASPAFWPRVLSHSELTEFHALRNAIDRALSAGSENQAVGMVTCTGHPQFNRGPEGVPLSLKPGAKSVAKPAEIRTNPEYFTKQAVYENIAPNADYPKPDFPRAPGPSSAARSPAACHSSLLQTRAR